MNEITEFVCPLCLLEVVAVHRGLHQAVEDHLFGRCRVVGVLSSDFIKPSTCVCGAVIVETHLGFLDVLATHIIGLNNHDRARHIALAQAGMQVKIVDPICF